MNNCGIYAIINICNDKHYIGSAVNFKNRKTKHFYKLTQGNHHNKHLQAAYNKQWPFDFIFVKLEYCLPEKLIEREQWWIDRLNSFKEGYNRRPLANSQLGFKHSEKTLAIYRKRDMKPLYEKSVKVRIGTKASAETKLKMSNAQKGKSKRKGHSENVKLSWIKRREKTTLILNPDKRCYYEYGRLKTCP